MPYISKDKRIQLKYALNKKASYSNGDFTFNDIGELLVSSGELNYVLTNICLGYLFNINYPSTELPRYDDFNEIIGVLECIKLELYRRAITPYEQRKIVENGDVYA